MVETFGDSAEQEYLYIKSGEDEYRNAGDVALFKYFKMELFRGGRQGKKRSSVDDAEAIWSSFGKMFMRTAAYRGGLISREYDLEHLLLCLEPEAACLQVKQHHDKVHQWENGMKLMVLDCGGGTIDITTHHVVSTEPIGLEELEEPCGGPWGSTVADVKFKEFMKKLLGCSNSTWAKLEESTEMFSLMSEWENKKTDHHPGKKVWISIAEMLDHELIGMSKEGFENARRRFNAGSSAHVGGMGKKLWLSADLVNSFFEDAIVEIIKETDIVLTRQPGISVVYLVGGFSASPLLQEAVTKGLERSGLRVQTLPKPGLAIVLGAARFGSNSESTFLSRKARLTYGTMTNTKYDNDNPQHQPRRSQTKFIGDGFYLRVFSSYVERGMDLPVGTFNSGQTVQLPLLTVSQLLPKHVRRTLARISGLTGELSEANLTRALCVHHKFKADSVVDAAKAAAEVKKLLTMGSESTALNRIEAAWGRLKTYFDNPSVELIICDSEGMYAGGPACIITSAFVVSSRLNSRLRYTFGASVGPVRSSLGALSLLGEVVRRSPRLRAASPSEVVPPCLPTGGASREAAEPGVVPPTPVPAGGAGSTGGPSGVGAKAASWRSVVPGAQSGFSSNDVEEELTAKRHLADLSVPGAVNSMMCPAQAILDSGAGGQAGDAIQPVDREEVPDEAVERLATREPEMVMSPLEEETGWEAALTEALQSVSAAGLSGNGVRKLIAIVDRHHNVFVGLCGAIRQRTWNPWW
eukprot:g19780.t1